MTRQHSAEWLAQVGDRVRQPVMRLLETARGLLQTSLDPSQRDQVRDIQVGAEATLDHIDDLLDYIGIESGRLELKQIDFDLGVLLDGATRELSLLAGDQGVRFACQVRDGVPSLTRGDPGRLRQLIGGLVGHALRRSRDQELTLQVSVASETETTVTLRFALLGFDPQLLEWEGLTLAVARHLAAMMNGQISQAVAPGAFGASGSAIQGGLWFTAVLSRPLDAKQEGPVGRVAGLRVLVLSDDATTRAALGQQLGGWGCRHEEVASQREAVQRLQFAADAVDPMDLLVVDTSQDGTELEQLGRAVSSAVGSRTRLILITSPAQRGDAARMEAAGYAAYLTRPVRGEELQSCLAVVAGGAPESIITRYVLAERRKRALRILVVEHNPVNRKLALRILQRLGYRAEAVARADEALARLSRQRPDLVLMELEILNSASGEGLRTIRGLDIPVIGITTREQPTLGVLEPVLSHTLLRPLDPDRLKQAIERLLPTGVGVPAGGASARTSSLFNRRELMERLDGDEALCRDVLRTFIEAAPPLMQAMRDALNRDEMAVVQGKARTLMDAAANVSAEGIRSLAHRLERASRTNQVAEAASLLDQLGQLLEVLDRHVGHATL